MFSPQGVPKRTGLGRSEKSESVVLDVSPGELAPWEPGHPLTAKPLPEDKSWQFIVYGGRYDVGLARKELVETFGRDDKEADGRVGGETALFAFTVDADGCLIAGTATLSACAWALSRLQSPGPNHRGWLDGFEFEERAFVDALDRLAPHKPEAVAEPTGALASVGEAVAQHVKGAAADAIAEGAKATGVAVGAAVGVGVGSVAGPIAGGIAGAVAGKFAERLLTPGRRRTAADDNTQPAESDAGPTLPRLRLTMSDLHSFVSQLAAAMGIEKKLDIAGVRVKCVQVHVKSDDAAGTEQSFLNSFIANDLAQIEQAVAADSFGAALSTYLAEASVATKIDVRSDRATVLSSVEPEAIPGGRWPVTTDWPLVMSQQFSVNQIMRELANHSGIFAVNGPPGTGKTTMLRDVLAAVVVDRARQLAGLRDPLDAFGEQVDQVEEVYSRATAKVHSVRPDLTGFEIVVATASNNAATNVTAEIPALGAVEGAVDEAVATDYFTDLASRVLDRPAWGLVAAALGNMENRNTFGHRFWWSDKDDTRAGMQEIFKKVREQPGTVQSWPAAVQAFQDAESALAVHAARRQAIADEISKLPQYEAAVRDLANAIGQLQAICDDHRNAARRASELERETQRIFEDVDREYQDWPRHKPSFWVVLSTWGRAGREWHQRHNELAAQRDGVRTQRDSHRDAAARHQSHLSQALHALEAKRKEHEQAERRLANAQVKITFAQRHWPGCVPNALADETEFQLCAPWGDPEFTAARNKLFLAALRLHKAFIFHSEKKIRHNLAVIVAFVRGRVKLRPETLLAAWQTLFLVVPMVSTTFASLPRLFAGLGSESLGWLFIDEAGQATAQQAAGGLWRCRRAVIVGDPQQLEPIVTLPRPAQDALRNYYGVSEQWTPDKTSVQLVADRHARFGTSLRDPGSDEEIWVGSPLRVHRRCDQPMFDISNTIAYGGDLMVFGTPPREPFAGDNAWINVSGPASDNWVPAEGEALAELLTELIRNGIDAKNIRVISPFRDAVAGSKGVARTTLRSLFDPKTAREFTEENVGTIHTVQGQEANVVVLVLGSKPDNNGARRWAADKPNLLNVAVSRAKRRLYVIGDKDKWRNLPYFNVLASTLPERPPSA
ncbi:DEAD/DEAH box helicase [Fodinicola acaciae]|uniref:DEAD/DEAH box helicase n=1 Tax=Fodinicola acaciae TaxID=2681555 RepID=UPI0013D8C724|nr:ATP-binding protein [Fodinicola acaciae]